MYLLVGLLRLKGGLGFVFRRSPLLTQDHPSGLLRRQGAVIRLQASCCSAFGVVCSLCEMRLRFQVTGCAECYMLTLEFILSRIHTRKYLTSLQKNNPKKLTNNKPSASECLTLLFTLFNNFLNLTGFLGTAYPRAALGKFWVLLVFCFEHNLALNT